MTFHADREFRIVDFGFDAKSVAITPQSTIRDQQSTIHFLMKGRDKFRFEDAAVHNQSLRVPSCPFVDDLHDVNSLRMPGGWDRGVGGRKQGRHRQAAVARLAPVAAP